MCSLVESFMENNLLARQMTGLVVDGRMWRQFMLRMANYLISEFIISSSNLLL